jgi:tape measure domain-containing protein
MIAGSIEIELFARIARLQSDMNQARQVVTRSTDGMERAANAAKAALAGIGAGIGLSQLVQMSDAYAKFTAQLRLASQSQREYAAAYGDVKRIANAAQQDLGATGMLYARIANGTRELGTTQKQVAAITETVNLALKVSGATATESASAQLQLSQAFASGTLRGEEFNAVNEAAPRLMLALADGIGVPVGALKKMAEEGKISSAIMADVLPKALAKVREEAAQIQTIGGALTVLKNNVMEFVGVQANASGAVATLTGAIGFLADNLVLIAGAVATLTTAKLASWLTNMVTNTYGAVTANRALAASTLASAVATTEAAAIAAAAKLAEAQSNVRATSTAMTLASARVAELRTAVLAAEGAVALAIATNGLIPAQARAIALAEANTVALAGQAVAASAATKAAIASTVAITAQTTAATFGARAMGVLRGAVGFLGGPIGAITTILGLGATAWAIWGSKGSEAEKQVANTLAEEIDDYLANLNRQIEKLKERNELAGKKMVSGAEPVTEHDKKREQIVAEINRISKQADLSVETKTEMLRVWGGRLNTVTADMEKFTAAQQKSKDLKFDGEYAEWLGKNGTAAQQIAYDLEELRKKYGQVTPAMEEFVRAKHVDS